CVRPCLPEGCDGRALTVENVLGNDHPGISLWPKLSGLLPSFDDFGQFAFQWNGAAFAILAACRQYLPVESQQFLWRRKDVFWVVHCKQGTMLNDPCCRALRMKTTPDISTVPLGYPKQREGSDWLRRSPARPAQCSRSKKSLAPADSASGCRGSAYSAVYRWPL